MPSAALRPCKQLGCRGLTRARYCLKHQEQESQQRKTNAKRYDDQRGNARQRGYNAIWEQVRKGKLLIDPICQRCTKVVAYEVHHIDHDATNNLDSNLLSTCRACHRQLHEQGKHQ